MVDITPLHLLTIKAMMKYEIDFAQYNSLDELRNELKKRQYLTFKEKYREYYRQRMVVLYNKDPQKYKTIRKESRERMIQADPEAYKQKQKEYRLKKKRTKLIEMGVCVL